MFAVVTPENIQWPPSAVVRLPGNWQDYRALTQQLGDRYNENTSSRYFPNIKVKEAIAQCFRIAYERNTSAAIRELRRKLSLSSKSGLFKKQSSFINSSSSFTIRKRRWLLHGETRTLPPMYS